MKKQIFILCLIVFASVYAEDEDVVFFDKLKGKQHYRYGAYIKINAPIEKVYSVLTDFGNFKNTMPRVKHSKIIKMEKNKVLVEYTFDILTGFDFTFDYTLQPFSKIEWDAVRGSFKRNEGTWILKKEKEGEGIIAIHTLYIEFKGVLGELIPQSLVDKVTKKIIRGALERVRDVAEGRFNVQGS